MRILFKANVNTSGGGDFAERMVLSVEQVSALYHTSTFLPSLLCISLKFKDHDVHMARNHCISKKSLKFGLLTDFEISNFRINLDLRSAISAT